MDTNKEREGALRQSQRETNKAAPPAGTKNNPDNLFIRVHSCSFVVCILLLACVAAMGADVTVKVDATAQGHRISTDFCGLSFEMSNLLPEKGKYLFTPKNTSLVTLFRTLGIRSLRVGGAMADRAGVAIPRPKDINQLFAFAKAAGVKVIYTVRLKKGNIGKDIEIADYVEKHYHDQLQCLAIGNEPNFYLRKYPEYLAAWKKFALAIRAKVPEAKFCGPSAYLANDWPGKFVSDLGSSELLAMVTQHAYLCGNAKGVSAKAGRDQLLSADLEQKYQGFYDTVARPVIARGLPYRFEETSNFTGGVPGASDAFASTLWALDYLHFWAEHGADGINFHNRRWITNCVIVPEWNEGKIVYRPRPIAYGLLAFSLGGHGTTAAVSVDNPKGVNLTVYAVQQGNQIFVTVINREHGWLARQTRVDIKVPGISWDAQEIFLRSPNGGSKAKSEIVLGNAEIGEDNLWHGQWQPARTNKAGEISVDLPAASAVVVRMDGQWH